jgi:hypothetical protein
MILSDELKKIINDIRDYNKLGKNCTSIFTSFKNNRSIKEEIEILTSYLDQYYPNASIGQRLYHIKESIQNPLFCPSCNLPRTYHRLNTGYFSTCGSKECQRNIKVTKIKKTLDERYDGNYFKPGSKAREKYESTMNEKYGVNHNFSKGELREKIKFTLLNKYGVDSPLKSDEIKIKRNSTCIDKYGTLNFISGDKAKKSNLLKYGSENSMLNKEISSKVAKSSSSTKRKIMSEKLLTFNISLIEYAMMRCELTCNKCLNTFRNHSVTINAKLRMQIDPCPKCNPVIKGKSKLEEELIEFVRSVYSGKIETNYRDLFKGNSEFSEVDSYLPDLNIAFEFNGLYWHSEIYKDKEYHQKKSKYLLSKGIKLYHIWEDDWVYKRNIVKSMISSILGKSDKIFARKCHIKEVNQSEYKSFCNQNHLSGYCPASRIIGLYYDDNLVSLMSFSKTRKLIDSKNSQYEYELIRSCSTLNKSVIGGVSKLISAFKKIIGGTLVTYCDVSFSPDPNLTGYIKSGFELIKSTTPGYYWVVDGKRSNRLNWTKSKLTYLGYDSSRTVDSIMNELGYYKVWDCGNHKFGLLA